MLFPNFRDFRKNLILGSHWTLAIPKDLKFRLSRNSKKFVWVTRFCGTNPTVRLVSSSEIFKIFKFSTCIIVVNYRFTIFQKNSISVGFYNMNIIIDYKYDMYVTDTSIIDIEMNISECLHMTG